MRFRELLPIILLVAGFAAGLLGGLILRPLPLTTTVTETLTRTVIVSFAGTMEEKSSWYTVTTTITITPLDSDGDGIPDLDENRYGTDPAKPNYLLAYALRKIPENEALRFKNVENFNESSKGLVDLYAKLSQDKKESKDVAELLNGILSDNIVDNLEKNLFDDKFVNPSLPSIDNLNWTPTRENLDKIYDINITFAARDDKTPIAYAELHFIPVEYYYMIEKYRMRPEDYPKVFPPDEERALILTPVDGKFDSLEEKFSVPIKDIVGGREYKIVALVGDLAGNKKMIEMRIPYIRQFENIAETDDILVGAFYYPWYNRNDPWFRFWFNETEWELLGYELSPLLGHYNSNDPIVISKHIDWATGHGIDYFLVSWGYAGGPGGFNDMVLKTLLENQLVGQIRFAILYESGGRLIKKEGEFNLTDSTNKNKLINDFNYLAKTYFSHPSYLEVKGGKVVFFDASRFFVGDVQDTLKLLREAIKVHKLYLICDALGNFLPPTDPRMMELLKSFDAFSADDMWANNYGDPDARRNFVSYIDKTLELWKLHTNAYNHDMIPSINPGWEPYLYLKLYPDFNAPFLERDTYRYGELLSIALKYGRHIIIGHFNEFFTHNHVEPDTKDGFAYLETLKKMLVKE
jgi:hypothetical protein